MELSRDLSPQFKALLEPLRKHFTPYRFCWVLTGISYLIAWNRGIALLYAVVALTLAALLLSHVLAWANMRGLRVIRDRAVAPAPGETPLLRYRLRAPGRRHFLLIDEPQLATVTGTMIAQFDRETVIERELGELHRGVYPLSTLHVSSAYPFGLFSREREVVQKPHKLVVYPRLHDVLRLPEPLVQAHTADAEAVLQRRRGWEEFAGVREQRPGESLKHVHWRASARQNQLMVKEYEALDVPGMLIVLPQQRGFECGTVPHSCFEYAIELAVSLTRAACHAGHPVHCVSYGKRERQLHLAAHTTEMSPMLEWFAHATPDGTVQLTEAVARARHKFAHPGWLVTFRHDGDALDIGRHGARHLDFTFAAQSFREPHAEKTDSYVNVSLSVVRYHVTCHASLPTLFL
ncbi:MAG: DUF58 domain-containing protein [Gammaproteobacteria bacterium]|nr:DUF58 domain-containing protein [Gammaproteobacteria bacterium]